LELAFVLFQDVNVLCTPKMSIAGMLTSIQVLNNVGSIFHYVNWHDQLQKTPC